MRSSANSQISMSEKSIFGRFEVFFSTYKFFGGPGGYFLLVRFNVLTEKWAL